MDSRVDTTPPAAYDLKHEATPMLNLATPSAPSLRTARRPFQANRPGKGVETLNPRPFKIGAVSVKPMGKTGWAIRYHDPGTERDVRRRLAGLSQREAESVATTINHELLTKGGFLPGARPVLPTIAEGIADAIALRNTIAATRKDRAARASLFVRWLCDAHPTVKRWDQLRPALVKEYVLYLERGGRAFDTVRLNLAPIKLAWQHMSETYPDIIKPLPKIKLAAPPRREIEILEPAEVDALLCWLREKSPVLWSMASLSALAGLRILEVCALREQDVDLLAQTLTVTDTGRHRPKTISSFRTIPLPTGAIIALESAMENRKVRPATGEIFCNAAGNRWTKDGITLRWKRTLRRAACELGMPRLATIPPRKLRAFFATTASRLGAPDRLLKRYLGHNGGSVLDAHYRQVSLAELRTVSGLMENWRNAPAQSEDAGNILATLAGE